MKKRIVSLFVLLMVVGLAGAMPVTADSYPFVYDTDNYIKIASAADLTAFSAAINDGTLPATTNARLAADIVLRADADNWASWGTTAPDTTATPAWVPIGNATNQYNGTFDGAGHTVSGIYITNAGSQYLGLFGVADSSAKIKNLGVINSWINGDGSLGGGGVVGFNYGTISNCYNTGTVSGSLIGGVAGFNFGTISNCYNTGTVSGSVYVGGAVGYNVGTISNCYNTGTVSGGAYIGGVAGYNENSKTISNSYNTGTVSGNAHVGGVTGTNLGIISNCYNTGAVSGYSDVGGVVGDATTGVSKCYYAQDSVATGIYGIGNNQDVLNVTEAKATTAFASGEVAYLLNKYNSPNGYPVDWFGWTQEKDRTTPTFSFDGIKVINQKITFVYADSAPETYDYGYFGGTILSLPKQPAASIYTYTQANGTILSQTAMTTYQIQKDETFTVNKYQLTENSEGVIEIGTAAELTEFSRYVNSGNTTANAVLTANIVLRVDADNWASWGTTAPNTTATPAWVPIGNATNQYSGTFDGASHTVSGIYITNAGYQFLGLFGVADSSAKITNLGVINSWISGDSGIGGVVGMNKGTISNCYNTGYNTGTVSGSFIGGVTGLNYGSISNCYNTGTVSGNARVGGVTGTNLGIISNCYNTGAVSGNSDVGGVVGYATTGVSKCYYAQDSVANGIYGIGNNQDVLDITEAKSAAAFASGEVAYLLQKGQASQTPQVWGQKLTGSVDALPVLKSTDPICKITYLKGDGTTTYQVGYTNQNQTTTPVALATGYVWKDANQALFTGTTLVGTDLSVHCCIATLPTATANYGTKLSDILFSGGSVDVTKWSWSDPANNQVPALGNSAAYQATYTSTDAIFGTMTFAITPTIVNPGGGGGTPIMSGIIVNPGTITFDPAGNLAVDITGAPAGSVVYYSLDGITFTTTPPAMENAGEHQVYIKITSPGYQDYITQTTVTVEKHEAPVIPELRVPVPIGQQTGSTDLGALLPPNRGQIHYQLVGVSDPGAILNGSPTIDQNGWITYGFASPLSASGEQLTAAVEERASLSVTITVRVTMENYADTTITLVVTQAEAIGVQYQTHIQDIGWENDWKTDGTLSGTFGQSKRLEALKVKLTGDFPAGATIDTEVHVQNYGNLGPFNMGTTAGTTGEGLRLENICLTLKNLPGYTLFYDVHVQNQGWLRDENDSSTWFKSGETAGTVALGLRLEGIRIKLVKTE
ncbi:MAG: hypothetical protein HY818_11200 [Acetobacterium woodii]|nr:hypothetical protein [Acetobacterium woodii]